MSLKSYIEAKELMEKNQPLFDPFKGCSKEIINKAENILNLKFPADYRVFLEDYGTVTFGSTEILGITGDEFYNSCVPNGIWYTLSGRKTGMPDSLIVIYEVGNGELFVLNYGNLNENKEPKVTSYWPGFDLKTQTFEIIANDFGDFLLNSVKDVIKNQ